MMTKKRLQIAIDMLDEAKGIVSGDRMEKYGDPRVNHGRTAAFWSTYLGIPVTDRQVCMMNILQKVGRDCHSPQGDNVVDIVGYATNIALLDSEL